MIQHDQAKELRRRFLLTCLQRNRNHQLRLKALAEVAALREAEPFDDAVEVVAAWPRDERRAGAKILLQALAEKRIGRRDQAQAWVWRLAEITRELHEEYAVQRWPETKRLLGLFVNSSGRAHGRNARRIVHAARQQDRRLAVALLAASVAHTPEAEEVLRGARMRMARKPSAVARELLRNFPKGGGKRRRRRPSARAAAARRTAGGASAATAAARPRAREASEDDRGRGRGRRGRGEADKGPGVLDHVGAQRQRLAAARSLQLGALGLAGIRRSLRGGEDRAAASADGQKPYPRAQGLSSDDRDRRCRSDVDRSRGSSTAGARRTMATDEALRRYKRIRDHCAGSRSDGRRSYVQGCGTRASSGRSDRRRSTSDSDRDRLAGVNLGYLSRPDRNLPRKRATHRPPEAQARSTLWVNVMKAPRGNGT